MKMRDDWVRESIRRRWLKGRERELEMDKDEKQWEKSDSSFYHDQ